MRKTVLLGLIVALTLALTVAAHGVDAPKTMNVQGRLTGSDGSPPPAADWTFNFKIYTTKLLGTGDVVWPDRDGEDQVIATDDDGLWNALIGAAKPLSHGVFSDTVRWLEITVTGDAVPAEILPRVRLVTGPFAFRVATVDGALGGNIVSKVSIGSGHTNTGSSAFVAGGSNSATGDYTAVAGGTFNDAGGNWSAIGGGYSNIASGDAAVVGGGNQDTADGYRTTITGGEGNRAFGSWSTVQGGFQNKATGTGSTIGGGGANKARGWGAVVAGGGMAPGTGTDADSNAANGNYSTVPGGRGNIAGGNYGFAAGRRARAEHDGAFVWGDSHDGDVTSSAVNQFIVRASGGVCLYSNTTLSSGVVLPAGGGAWNGISDRNVKENFRPVDGAELLDKIAQLEISRWNFKTQDPSIEHIGPMAQDFQRLFGVGDNNTTISTVDPDGIALAAIQELHRQNQSLQTQNEILKSEIQELRRLIEELATQQ
ncbi:MAG TPA: tail fiber domain-containing protein [Acidobacteriota bacterium]|nr:tail fiber domain-containing protein [Acidobacteriota bacterium]